MKLLIEQTDNIETLLEANPQGGKNLYIHGVFMQQGIRNHNGRIYPPKVMEPEVARYIAEEINKNRGWGELNHPPTPQVNLERTSHRITELRQDGNNFIGKALVLNTPMGNIVRGLLEGGSGIGVSSRAVGSLKSVNGVNEVQSDFRLSTAADVVGNPSAPDAFVTGIMEGADWVWDETLGWSARSIVEAVKTAVDHNAKILTENDKLKAFVTFINRVKDVSFKNTK